LVILVHRSVFDHSVVGIPGNITISGDPSPLLFYVDHNQLWQITNETYILPVNVVNTTASTEDLMPYKLVIGDKREGISNAIWRWRGTVLYLDIGEMTNSALYYSCPNKAGQYGVYTYLDS